MEKRLRKGFIACTCGLLIANLAVTTQAKSAAATGLQGSMVTDQARYAPGQTVLLDVTLTNTGDIAITGALQLSFLHLNRQVASLTPGTVTIPPHATRTLAVHWRPPATDYQGYLIEGSLRSRTGIVPDTFETAVDVSSDWTKFPRYGYVSAYPKMTASAVKNELIALKNYHIDGLQFYDWQWKHHVPLAGTVAHPAASWQDIAGRATVRQTILDMIQTGHQLGMKSLNYNLMYGAWNGYQTDGSGVKPAWGLFSDTKAQSQVNIPMPAGWNAQAIYVFNPGNPAWRHYILSQEARVFRAYPFDGWQVDQLGDQGFVYDAHGQPVDLESSFTPFLNDAVKTLHRQIIFNNVGGYGLQSVASHSNEAIAYVECWPSSGQVTYADLQNTIDAVNADSHGKKATVLAAYLDSNDAQGFSAQHPGTFDNAGVLLTDAAIMASGGDHIELGDHLQMLDAPYFPNHNLAMDQSLKTQLLSYYNFFVAYENLLRGGLQTTQNNVVLRGYDSSNDGSAGTVWEFSKANAHYDTIQLVNLLGQANTLWQDADANKTVPHPLHHIAVQYYYGHARIHSVSFATPDHGGGVSTSLHFAYGQDKKGKFITFTVPELQYWDMIYISKA